MKRLSRREMITLSALGLLGAGCAGSQRQGGFFARQGVPVGLALYTLGLDANANFDATFAAVAEIGYGEVEIQGLLNRDGRTWKAALDRAGLTCGSMHIPANLGAGPSLSEELDRIADAALTVGARHVVLASPILPANAVPAPDEGRVAFFVRAVQSMTVDDWRRFASILNETGARAQARGLTFCYHNHNVEFSPVGGSTGLEILLAETDPAAVSFEMDVGWVTAAGRDPLPLFAVHPGRFRLMHVKDVRASAVANTVLHIDNAVVGTGKVRWSEVLPAAYAAGVRHFYVEQDPPYETSRMEIARMSYLNLSRV